MAPTTAPTVVRECYLMCTDIGNNNNKFYHLEIIDTGGQLELVKTFGRVGDAGQKVVEAFGTDRASADYEFDKVHRQKTRGSGSRSQYTEMQIVGKSDGASVVRTLGGGVIQARDAVRQGVRAPTTWSAAAQDFYNRLLHDATCLVETGMQVSRVTSDGLDTPLGKVGETQVRQAQALLTDILDAITRHDAAALLKHNSKFYTLIPTPVGRSADALKAAMLTTREAVADKDQLLDTALSLIAAQQPGAATHGTTAPHLTLGDCDAADTTMLNELLRAERCRCHANERLTFKRAFRVTRPNDIAKFRTDLYTKLDEARPLFHGTRRGTGAGILSRGFLPTNAARASGGHYSGSAYGDGIYFASNAGKSLGYTGAAVGERLMFVTFVAMGTRYTHKGRAPGAFGSFRRPAGYDSVHAIGGNDLAHDEMIVPTPDQALIAYVVEV